METTNEDRHDDRKGRSAKVIEEVNTLIDEYLMGCALDAFSERIVFASDLFPKITSIVHPDYEEVSRKISMLFLKVHEALPSEEAKKNHFLFEANVNRRSVINEESATIAGIVLGMRLAGASSEQITKLGRAYCRINTLPQVE